MFATIHAIPRDHTRCLHFGTIQILMLSGDGGSYYKTSQNRVCSLFFLNLSERYTNVTLHGNHAVPHTQRKKQYKIRIYF